MGPMERDTNQANEQQQRPRLALHAGILLAAFCLIIGLSWAQHGRHFVEKIITQLILPCGAVWVMLLVVTYWALITQRKWFSLPLLAVFLFYWTTGCTYTGVNAIHSLERRYPAVSIDEVEPLDLVVVLGGGTRSNLDGQAWLSTSGDRVILAARLYQRGKTARLAATGRVYEWVEEQTISLAESAEQIWTDLGIPESDILLIDGRNTSEELHNLSELIENHSQQRVGLLTSAYHLPRAMRLAKANGLDLIPLAADQQAGTIDAVPLCLIPSRRGFRMTELAAKEYLAALVKR